MLKLVFLTLFLSDVWAVPQNVQQKSIGSRLIGGATAKSGQFPDAAAIYIFTEFGTYFCAGSLISDEWILTAGQCVYGATSFWILLGSHSLLNPGPEAVTVVAVEFVLHPEFNPITLENDIALIKLDVPVTITTHITPIHILAPGRLPSAASVLTYGWGHTNDDATGLEDVLNYNYFTTLSNSECSETYGSQITSGMVCALGRNNEGSCHGDSGSPLLQYSVNGNVYHVGITSFVSANGCQSADPSGYTRTSDYVEWIRQVANL